MDIFSFTDPVFDTEPFNLQDLRAVQRELKTFYYMPFQHTPKFDKEGQPMAYYLQSHDAFVIHPDNVVLFREQLSTAGYRFEELIRGEFVQRQRPIWTYTKSKLLI